MEFPEDFSEQTKQGIMDFLKVLNGEMTMDEFHLRNPGAHLEGVVSLDSEGRVLEDLSDQFVGSTPALDELLNINNITTQQPPNPSEETD